MATRLKTFSKTKKDNLLKEIKKHREADQIVQGTYGEENGKWRGCAVGCSIHSLNILEGKEYSTSDHKVYEKELGIPAELAYLEDSLFEEMPKEQAMLWPERFIKAVPVGADLSHVVSKFVIWQFEDKKYGLKNIKEVQDDKEIYGFCEEVVSLYKRSLTEEVSEKDYYDLYKKIDGARDWALAWAGDWAGAWARAWAWAGAGAGAGAGAWAGAGAGAGAWAGAGADYDKNILATSDKLIELIEEARR